MYDVFLSYNRQDQKTVERVAKALRKRGLRVFLDRWYLVSGRSWVDGLEKTLADCRAVAVFIGPGGIGRWQQREKDLALDRQAEDPTFPVIPVLLPEGDPALGFLKLNTWVDLREGVTPEAIEILACAARGKPPGDELQARISEALASICPYRSLQQFREEDEPFFCGRKAFTDKLVDAVASNSLIAVVGASGSGKSSVVRAGLVPRLRRRTGRRAASRRVWDVVTIMPGERPVRSLADGFLALLEPDLSEADRLSGVGKLADGLMSGDIQLREVIDRALVKQPGTNRILLVVDQWEELYTLCHDEPTRQRFVTHLLDALGAGKLSMILTVRGDFYGHVTDDRVLCDRIDKVVNISPMTRGELCSAIVEPAKQVGLRFEEGLVEIILKDVGDEPGRLPLLEFLLTELWERRDHGEMLLEAYSQIGGVTGAIAERAEESFNELGPKDREEAHWAMVRLVAAGPEASHTRRRAILSDLDAAAKNVVSKFTMDRLLVTTRDESGREIVEVGHEALIREWPRLKKWVDLDRDFLRTLQRLEEESEFWEQRDRAADYLLLPGRLLIDAEELLKHRPKLVSVRVRAYVEASLAAERQRQELVQQTELERLEQEKTIALERAEHQQMVAEKERAKAEAAHRLVSRTRLFAIAASILVIIAGVVAGIAVQRHSIAKTEARRADLAMVLALDRTKKSLEYTKKNVSNGRISTEAAQAHLEDVESLIAGLAQIEQTSATSDVITNYQLELLWAISDVYADMGKTQEALQRAQDAKRLATRRAQTNPDNVESMRTLFMGAFRIGDMLAKQDDLDGALSEYRFALVTADKLAAKAPDNLRAQFNRSFVQNKIGNIFQLRGDYAMALKEYNASLGVIGPVVDQELNNTEWKRQLATTRTWIGEVYQAQGNLDEAVKQFEIVLRIRKDVADRSPPYDPSARSNLAGALSRLGDALVLRDDPDGALGYFLEAFEIRKAVSDRDPANLDSYSGLASGYQTLGDARRMKGDLEGALVDYNKALPMRETLAAKDPSNVSRQSNLAAGHSRIADVLAEQGDPDRALAHYSTAVAVLEPLLKKGPDNKESGNVRLRRDLFAYQTRIGDVLARHATPDESLAAYRIALQSAELLVPKRPIMARWQPSLPYAYNRTGDVLRRKGDLADALAAYRSAVKVAQQLDDSLWRSPAGPRDFAESRMRIAEIQRWQGNDSAACDEDRAALGILKKVTEKTRNDKELTVAIEGIEDRFNCSLLTGTVKP